ncbi:hypothetical protein [Leuconostoc falkenbergense]|uniref:hypothetical protein n=1 Tax=Leuconostoc falkenbergense TaxID=2766470 RepID=UPI0024AE53C8|nr:hypothetical protein [Leuconostoc falkenbergense]
MFFYIKTPISSQPMVRKGTNGKRFCDDNAKKSVAKQQPSNKPSTKTKVVVEKMSVNKTGISPDPKACRI